VPVEVRVRVHGNRMRPHRWPTLGSYSDLRLVLDPRRQPRVCCRHILVVCSVNATVSTAMRCIHASCVLLAPVRALVSSAARAMPMPRPIPPPDLHLNPDCRRPNLGGRPLRGGPRTGLARKQSIINPSRMCRLLPGNTRKNYSVCRHDRPGILATLSQQWSELSWPCNLSYRAGEPECRAVNMRLDLPILSLSRRAQMPRGAFGPDRNLCSPLALWRRLGASAPPG